MERFCRTRRPPVIAGDESRRLATFNGDNVQNGHKCDQGRIQEYLSHHLTKLFIANSSSFSVISISVICVFTVFQLLENDFAFRKKKKRLRYLFTGPTST